MWWLDDESDDAKISAVLEMLARIGRRVGRPLAVASTYVVTLPAFGTSFFKALCIAGIALFLMMLPLGRRPIQFLALALLFYTLAWWLDFVPDPARGLRAFLRDVDHVGTD
jgi:hypothetical protein